MQVVCPGCGEVVLIKVKTGRAPLNISVTNVYDALRANSTVSGAAKKLGCSRGYIYKVLAEHGLKPGDFIKGRV